jgi:L-ascorbate metabolism protein UlaG (beta-lactamase superfamily)
MTNACIRQFPQASATRSSGRAAGLWRRLAQALWLCAAGACLPLAAATEQPTAAPSKIQLLWLGQSAFRIHTLSGKVIVIDPYLMNNPKTPEAYRKLEALGKVDLILVTHAHGDHFADAPALARLNNAPVVGPAGLDQSIQTLGILPPELAPRMNKGGTIAPFAAAGVSGVRITQVRAEHSSELLWRNPATGKDETHVGGEPVGFIIELENGFRIYHMGDTGLFGDMKLIGEHYKPDLVLIPIGGHFVLDPADAAFAIREYLKPRYVIPMHYGTTPLLKGTPEEFTAALGATATKVMVLKPGDEVEF